MGGAPQTSMAMLASTIWHMCNIGFMTSALALALTLALTADVARKSTLLHGLGEFQEELQHPLVQLEGRAGVVGGDLGAHARRMKLREAAERVVDGPPELLQVTQQEEVLLQAAPGGQAVELVLAEEEDVQLHGGGDNQGVAHHRVLEPRFLLVLRPSFFGSGLRRHD